ncbi:TPA: hypothetical protein DDW69_02580 [candidate division CPR2 bacterium]|nr:MAG: hypothetical protein A2Y27_01300 [candidate division CPR2 bacterium GWD1_39_7]OGB72170.1 MAG: hypothetical protein A2Y26_00640 [candidate division CPR2 bacterium GWD2_39_7]HBG81706.1 hypothetical protein [candidate division CPR2 bacterium]HCL99651.1 hypothetical protein [candidate division CPR2 bacterium]
MADGELQITSVSPSVNSTSVPVNLVNGISVSFSNSGVVIDENTLKANVSITSPSDSVFIKYFRTYSSGFSFEIAREATSFNNCQLKPFTNYTVRINGGYSGIMGLHALEPHYLLEEGYSWSFTTGADTVLPNLKFTSKSEAPTVNALVSWEADEQVRYELQYGYPGSTLSKKHDSNYKTRHEGSLSDLIINKVYDVKLFAWDSSGNQSSSDFKIETLSILDVSINLLSNSAEIRWKTSRPTDTTVEYGVSENYENSATVSGMGNNHLITIKNLVFGKNKYHFRIKALESFGVSYSGDFNFETLATNPGFYRNEGFYIGENVGGGQNPPSAIEKIISNQSAFPVSLVTPTPSIVNTGDKNSENGKVKGVESIKELSQDSVSKKGGSYLSIFLFGAMVLAALGFFYYKDLERFKKKALQFKKYFLPQGWIFLIRSLNTRIDDSVDRFVSRKLEEKEESKEKSIY